MRLHTVLMLTVMAALLSGCAGFYNQSYSCMPSYSRRLGEDVELYKRPPVIDAQGYAHC